MAKYDVESLLTDLVAIVTSNLNTKLAAITAEKGDGLTLYTLDSNKVFLQSLENAEAAASPFFLFAGLDDPEAIGRGPATALKINFYMILLVQDTAEQQVFIKKMLRYMRAMREIFEDNYAKIPQVSRLEVTSVAPVNMELLNAPGMYKATGVKIMAAIG